MSHPSELALSSSTCTFIPMLPQEIHRVPESIRRSVKLGKHRRFSQKNSVGASVNPEHKPGNLDNKALISPLALTANKLPFTTSSFHIDVPPRPGGPRYSSADNSHFSYQAVSQSVERTHDFRKRLLPAKRAMQPFESLLKTGRAAEQYKISFLNIEKLRLTNMYGPIDQGPQCPKTPQPTPYTSISPIKLRRCSFNICRERIHPLINFTFDQKPSPVLPLKPFVPPFERYRYRDFIWKAAFSFHVRHSPPQQYSPKLRIYVGGGNNSMLIRSLFKIRAGWWTFTDKIEDANLVWTQIKLMEYFKMQLMSSKEAKAIQNNDSSKEKEDHHFNKGAYLKNTPKQSKPQIESKIHSDTKKQEPIQALEIQLLQLKIQQKPNRCTQEPTQCSHEQQHQHHIRHPQKQSESGETEENKSKLTHKYANHNKLFTQAQLIAWDKYWSKSRRFEAKLDEGMGVRNKITTSNFAQISLASPSKPLKVHNHLPNNYIISNKKALFYTMKEYYELIGQNPFDYLPLTFHVQNGLQDPIYLEFLKKFYQRQRKGKGLDNKGQAGVNGGQPNSTLSPIIALSPSVSVKEEPSQAESDNMPQSPEGKQVVSLENHKVEYSELQKAEISESTQTKSTTPQAVRNIWIVKPGQFTNRGNGIIVCQSLAEIKTILKQKQRHDNGNPKTYIIQSYLDRPFLYQKRKFDIRHYMMVTSINGIVKGYWYELGYIRTTSYEYTLKSSTSSVHLTNDAVQKYLPEYGRFEKGNKLTYVQFQRYLDKEYKSSKLNFFQTVMPGMKRIATDVIRASALKIDPSRMAPNFQIFGLDFMIDQDFKPWLIQVNNNPCLELSCPLLGDIIPKMVENALRICVDSLAPPPQSITQKRPRFSDNPFETNLFGLVYDSLTEEKQLRSLYRGKESDLNSFSMPNDDDQVFEDDGDELDL